MDIYLPIAEVSVSVVLLIGLGSGIGLLSGIFGVGGGFLMTPLLIFVGIPPPVAVASGAPQILASSVSGAIAQFRRGQVDIKMGLVLTAGGLVGAALGTTLFARLRATGQIDLVIALCYVVFLGAVGGLMLIESIGAIWRARRTDAGSGGAAKPNRRTRGGLTHRLPLKMRFRRSQLYISALVPLALGGFVGVLTAIMGVGGGFLMVPAMIYLLRMPTAAVIGTSLFQICFVTAGTTFLHATQNRTVDAVLALMLIAGGVIGAQFGSRIGARLPGEQIRVLLALLVLAVCARLVSDLIVRPDDIYSLAALRTP